MTKYIIPTIDMDASANCDSQSPNTLLREADSIFFWLFAATTPLVVWLAWMGQTGRFNSAICQTGTTPMVVTGDWWLALGVTGFVTAGSLLIWQKFSASGWGATWNAVGSMVFTALIMHFGGGSGEAHFPFFVFTSFLIYYHSWRPIATACAVIAAHHVAFFVMQGLGMPVVVFACITPGTLTVHLLIAAVQGVMLGFMAERMAQRTELAERAHSRIIEGQRFLSEMIEHSGMIIYAKDKSGVYQFVNSRYENVVGVARKDVLGKTDADILPDDIARQFRSNDLAVMESGTAQETEELLDGPEGQRYFISIKFPYRDLQNNISGLCGMSTEITERKRMEEALKHRSAELSALNSVSRQVSSSLDFANVAQLFLDECLRAVNPSLAILFMREGNQLGLIAHATSGDATPHEDTPVHCVGECLCGLAAASGAPVYCSDIFSDPRCTWNECKKAGVRSFAALPLRSGETVIGVLGLASATERDFEAQSTFLETLADHAAVGLQNARLHDQIKLHAAQLEKRVEERTAQLEAARKQAEAANVAKSAFLANMSHEIRTPLNAITGMVHLMRRGGATPEQDDKLNKIENAGNHLMEIINTILDLSKIEAGKLTLERGPICIDELIENVSSMIGEKARAKGLSLKQEISTHPEYLLGDRIRLQQALLNYAANAVKFTDQGSVTLRVRVEEDNPDDALIRFEVEDTGTGIAPDALPRLFTSFEQADNSITRQYGGTGLGLAITRRIAELMGGETGVSSEPGKGSNFWLTVRLQKSDMLCGVVSAHALTDAEAALKDGFAGTLILLAEDEPMNREVTLSLLEDAGLSVDIAEDGEQALKLAQKKDYALILMDMQMPNMDGLEATRQIHRLVTRKRIPIVAMTANAFAEDRAMCFAAGMDDFISKPVKPEQFYATLLNCLIKNQDA